MVGKASRPSYDDLAAQLAELRATVRALKAENARLRAEVVRLGGDDAPGSVVPADAPSAATGRATPPRWAKANVPPPPSGRPPRRSRAPVPGRKREPPTKRILHALDQCPHCQIPLSRGRVVNRRQIIDLPLPKAQVIEHVVRERRCPGCGQRYRPDPPDLSAQVGAHRRVSWRVTALVALLRTKLRLPVAQVQWLLEQGWGLRLSVGELCGLVAAAAQAGARTYADWWAEARQSPVASVDETSWREDGHNQIVWTVNTPTTRLFHCVPSRAGAVIRGLLGTDYDGVVVSDFYTAYDQLDGRHQRCWAHLLRAIHEAQFAQPDDRALADWAAEVQAIYQRALTWTAAAHARSPVEREQARVGFERELLACCRDPALDTPARRGLCQRVERYHPELFTFVALLDVAPTNNAAERAVRPLVVARKISGGTRSAEGTQARMILQSLVATWELRGQHPFAALLDLLREPRQTDNPVSILAPV
jgi:hypothetical protein